MTVAERAVLAALQRRRGEAVPHAALIAEVWPDPATRPAPEDQIEALRFLISGVRGMLHTANLRIESVPSSVCPPTGGWRLTLLRRGGAQGVRQEAAP